MLLEAIDIVLRNNTFHFNNEFFLQLKGTAMGTKMAPTYANLVMGYLEEKLYLQCEKKQGIAFRSFVEKECKRYLDDCYITWNESHGPLNIMNDLLADLHACINFTCEFNKDKISFLDILLLRDSVRQKITITYRRKGIRILKIVYEED